MKKNKEIFREYGSINFKESKDKMFINITFPQEIIIKKEGELQLIIPLKLCPIIKKTSIMLIRP